ncbi:seizure protein 6-like [Branchiostoma floridae]|uniref:Seizure protein 6-like n=1 Tax=Branchiostoma floridae TaxID=7739 RepID=A0A9J7NCG7_BRAFL|nr:seizure protein 6-like [Branchiostoma floridae]
MEGRPEGVIYSPGYPGRYPDDANCWWKVSVPGDKVIKVTFLLFDLRNVTDSLELIDGNDRTGRPLTAPLTGRKIPPRSNASSSNVIWINFQSDNMQRGRGFILKYEAIGHCGKISLNDGRGTVSPDHNGYFGIGETARIDCDTSGETWSLVVECLGTGQFNVTHPYCKEAPPGGGTLPIAIGAAVGGVVLLAAAIATVVIVMKRKRR